MQIDRRSLSTRTLSVLAGVAVAALAFSAVGCAPPPPPPKHVEVAPAPPPPPAPEPPMEALKLPGGIKFATGKADLLPESEPALTYVVEYMAKTPNLKQLRVEGHTDNQGQPAANQKLSEDRAYSVSRWLVTHGVDCRRLVPLGYGDTKPIADNNTEEGRAQNRRTVFIDHRVRHEGSHHAGDPCH